MYLILAMTIISCSNIAGKYEPPRIPLEIIKAYNFSNTHPKDSAVVVEHSTSGKCKNYAMTLDVIEKIEANEQYSDNCLFVSIEDIVESNTNAFTFSTPLEFRMVSQEKNGNNNMWFVFKDHAAMRMDSSEDKVTCFDLKE